jgi:hypothetical protein
MHNIVEITGLPKKTLVYIVYYTETILIYTEKKGV